MFLWLKSLPTPRSRLEAEREVYSVLLIHQPRRIAEYTLTDDCTSRTCIQSLIDDFPELRRETVFDFQENNKQSYSLTDYLPPTIGDEFMSSGENPQFYQRISFSRIGFDSFLTQALVLVEDCRGEGCFDGTRDSIYSMGNLIFLQKIGDLWMIQNEQEAWLIEEIPH